MSYLGDYFTYGHKGRVYKYRDLVLDMAADMWNAANPPSRFLAEANRENETAVYCSAQNEHGNHTSVQRRRDHMSDVIMTGQYELYRVVTDMDALHEGFRDRVEELQATREGLDEAGQLQPGYSGKLLCNPPIKSFGRQSLPGMLRATGMALILVIDDERFASVKDQLGRRKRPMRSIVRIKRPKWLFTAEKARKASKKGWSTISPEMRSKMMRKVAKARWRARRKALLEVDNVNSIALAALCAPK